MVEQGVEPSVMEVPSTQRAVSEVVEQPTKRRRLAGRAKERRDSRGQLMCSEYAQGDVIPEEYGPQHFTPTRWL